MRFARDGYQLMFGATALAALAFAFALRMRSWPLWLLAFALTVLALCLSAPSAATFRVGVPSA